MPSAISAWEEPSQTGHYFGHRQNDIDRRPNQRDFARILVTRLALHEYGLMVTATH